MFTTRTGRLRTTATTSAEDCCRVRYETPRRRVRTTGTRRRAFRLLFLVVVVVVSRSHVLIGIIARTALLIITRCPDRAAALSSDASRHKAFAGSFPGKVKSFRFLEPTVTGIRRSDNYFASPFYVPVCSIRRVMTRYRTTTVKPLWHIYTFILHVYI